MKALLLGSSGWVAHYLIEELLAIGVEVIGISNQHKPVQNIQNIRLDMSLPEFVKKVSEIKCDVMINLLHSSDFERTVDVHIGLSDSCKKSNTHYIYMSSANALDGDPSQAHTENESPNGGSDYGKHKAKCESYLNTHFPEACIVRFTAIHGFAPNRISRTEEFLQSLSQREIVPIARQIFQNKMYVGHFAQIIAKLARDKHSGTFHIGTVDHSDMIDFFIALAERFGYDRSQIIEDKSYNFNSVMIPDKVLKLYGKEANFYEKDTLSELISCPHLSKYKKI